MIDRDIFRDPLVALNLPAAIRSRASSLLVTILGTESLGDLLRAADRAEGFVLGIATVRALQPIDVENLYLVLESATQGRQAELESGLQMVKPT